MLHQIRLFQKAHFRLMAFLARFFVKRCFNVAPNFTRFENVHFLSEVAGKFLFLRPKMTYLRDVRP